MTNNKSFLIRVDADGKVYQVEVKNTYVNTSGFGSPSNEIDQTLLKTTCGKPVNAPTEGGDGKYHVVGHDLLSHRASPATRIDK